MYKGKIKSIQQGQSIIIIIKSLKVIFSLLLAILTLSWIDVFFSISNIFRISIIIAIILFLFLSFIYIRRSSYQKTKSWLQKIYVQKPWMSYSPNVLSDIEAGSIHPTDNEDLSSIYYSDKGIFKNSKFDLKSNIAIKNFIGALFFCIGLFSFSAFMQVNPFTVFDFHNSKIVSDNLFHLHPMGGTFFYGKSVEIEIKNIDPSLKFIGFKFKTPLRAERLIALKAENGRYRTKIDSLVERTEYQAVFHRGFRKLFSRTYILEPLDPAYFQSISFRVRPPAYTKLSSYLTESNIIRVYYGSRISYNVKMNTNALVTLNKHPLKKAKELYSYLGSSYFHASQSLRIQFQASKQIKDTQMEIQSPVYEFITIEDKPPVVNIDSSSKQALKVNMVQKGILHFSFKMKDDFAIKYAAIFILRSNALIGTHEIKLSELKVNRLAKATEYSGNAQLNVSTFKGSNLSVVLGVRDNSLTPDKFSWDLKKSRGQTSISEYIQIRISQNEREEDDFRERSFSQLEKELNILNRQYQESEKEFKELLERANGKEEATSLVREAKVWKQRREQLQLSLKQINRQIKRNIKAGSMRERERKKEILKNLENVLNEKITRRESELSRLLKNFPKDFVKASEKIEQMTKKNYLRNLNSSLAHLKKLLALKKLSKVDRIIQKELESLRKRQDNLVLKKKEPSNLEHHKKRIQSASKKAARVSKTLASSTKKNSNLEFKGKMKAYWQSAMSKAMQGSSSQKMKSLGQMQSSLSSWQKKIREAMRRLSNEDKKKALVLFRQTAFRLNQISKVWKQRISQEDFDPVSYDKKNFKSLGEDLYALFDSYQAQVNHLIRKIDRTGLISNKVINELYSTEDYFKNLKTYIENKITLSTSAESNRLLWKLNRTSLSLLKEMGKMRMKMALMAGSQMGQKMGQSGKVEQAMRKVMQELAGKQSGKSGSLSSSEEEYLRELDRRQKKIANSLKNSLAQKELEGSSLEKEGKSLLKDIEALRNHLRKISNKKQLNEAEKKISELSKKFLKAKKSIKSKNKFTRKREAERAEEYVIHASLKKIKVIEKVTPMIEFDASNLSDVEKLFYKKYIENLSTSPE